MAKLSDADRANIGTRAAVMALILGEFDLVLSRRNGGPSVVQCRMPVCTECRWEMKRRAPGVWVCENARPWNFLRHDVILFGRPTVYGPVM